MSDMTEILCAIERRAERAIVQELRLMTQEILAMRAHLSLEQRAHADALLLKLDHLERCQQVDTAAPAMVGAATSSSVPVLPDLKFDNLEPLSPSHYLVHFYSHEAGDLERVALTETLASAAQLVRQHLADRLLPLWQVTHCAASGELAFLSDEDKVLASIEPCEPSTPVVEPMVAEACTALAAGDPAALRSLFVSPATLRQERLAA